MIVRSEKHLLMIILKEGIKINELTIKEDLKNKGICVLEDNFKYKKDIQKNDIISQVDLIVNMHKILAGCRFNGLIRMKSIIGKEVEEYKVQLKKLQRYYNTIVGCDCKGYMDKMILCEGKSLLKQGRDALGYINDCCYISIIERSMNRQEICLGRCDESNLRNNNGRLEIGSIKTMTYNLVEEDLYKYIKRLQRKQIDFNVEEVIKQFVYNSHLSASSLSYLRALCSYPRESLKAWQRYIENKRNKSEEEYLKQFINSIKYEDQRIYY